MINEGKVLFFSGVAAAPAGSRRGLLEGAWLTDHRMVLNLVTLLVLRCLLDPGNLLLLLHRFPGRLHPRLSLPAVALRDESHDQQGSEVRGQNTVTVFQSNS